jgi:hypothetical protein
MKRYIPYIALCLMLIGGLVWAIPPSPPSSGSSGVNTTYDANSDSIIDADKVATLNQDTTGNASTATALASDPSDCAALGLATAIDASGNLTCGYAIGTDVPGISGTPTDEQIVCWEQDGSAWKQKACGAKITYTEPATNTTICRTGATTTGACTNPIKLASFGWDNGTSAVTAEEASKRCVAVPTVATITGWTMVISGDPGAGGTIVTLTKDSLADTLTAGALPTTDIDASAPPTVADDEVAANDETLTGWTKTVAANDIICATVATNAVATWISLTIYGTY